MGSEEPSERAARASLGCTAEGVAQEQAYTVLGEGRGVSEALVGISFTCAQCRLQIALISFYGPAQRLFEL